MRPSQLEEEPRVVEMEVLELCGVMTALVTPMTAEGELDLDGLRRLVERQVEGRVSALVPCGTTGETPTLAASEQEEVISRVVEYAAGRIPVVAGAGASSTAAACQLAEAARRAGAEATLQVTPYYNRPTQDGLYRHFVAVAEQSEIPVILYNIPGRTGVRLEVETIARLAQHPLIVAIKEATGDLGFASRLRQQAPELVVLSGDDALTLPLMALGARGVVSVASNVLPAQVVELVEAMAGGDPVRARECHFQLLPFFAALFLETNPIPVKAALALRGLCGETLRLPLVPAQDATRQALRQALSPWDVP